jgi:hypothetical protein
MSFFKNFSFAIQKVRLAQTISTPTFNPKTTTAEPAMFFPNPQTNFGLAKEPVIQRVAWFQKRPQPSPVTTIRNIGTPVFRLGLLKERK